MLTANETIATLKASPATSLNLDAGGNDGTGNLYKKNTHTKKQQKFITEHQVQIQTYKQKYYSLLSDSK